MLLITRRVSLSNQKAERRVIVDQCCGSCYPCSNPTWGQFLPRDAPGFPVWSTDGGAGGVPWGLGEGGGRGVGGRGGRAEGSTDVMEYRRARSEQCCDTRPCGRSYHSQVIIIIMGLGHGFQTCGTCTSWWYISHCEVVHLEAQMKKK